MTKQFIDDFKEGNRINSVFSIKYKKRFKSYKGGYMFTLGLADKTAEIEAKYWGKDDEKKVKKLFDSLETGDVIKIKGKVSSYRKKLELNIQDGNLEKTNDFEIENFIETTDKDLDLLYDELVEYLSSIKNESLSKLIDKFLEDEKTMEKFKKSPAAMFYHHAYVGGLLEHTLDIIKLGDKLVELHPKLDRDLMIIGSFLHDIGKIKEFNVTTNIKQSRIGLLSGHIPLGQEILITKINELDVFPDDLKHKLLHIISSHHGKREYGAIKEPMFPEAAAIYYLDELDSQIFQYIDLKENADTEDFHIWNKRFGQLYLE